MPVKTDAQRINTIKKILNILYNYKPQKTQQEMLKRHKGSQNNQKFAITGKEIHDAQHGFSCGHVAKAFAYENSLLPEDEQLDIKIMSGTRPDAFIDSMYIHTLPCVKMADGNYYAIDPQVKNSGLPMIKTPVIVGNKKKHILPSMAEYPEYTITALVDWTDERLYDFNKFAKMSSYRSKETQKIISEIETILKYTANNKEHFYAFCDEMVKQKPDIAKRMHVVVIEQKDTKNHVIEPLCRIALELKTADGQKQMCYFAPNGSYAELKKMDEDDKILWKLQLSKYVNLYNNIDKTEEYLLKNSKIKELSKKEPENIPDDNTILSVEEIRKDVSTLARILIRGYVGWPYHDMTTKIAVLDMLKNIYDKDQEMTIEKFKRTIGYITLLIPDNHLKIAFTRPRFRQPFVGENYAVDPKVFFGRINDTAIVALKTLNNNNLSKDEWFLLRNLTKWAQMDLPTSKALIVDLRGNGGGNDGPTNAFAKYLCGGVTNYPAIQEWVRTNKTANDIAQKGKLRDIRKKHNLPEAEEPQLYQPKHATYKNGEFIYINKEKAYMKPIYILTDKRTGSSAERFILAMRHHPMVRFVGDNSGGTEVFGNMSSTMYLPHSKAVVVVGTHYRSLSRDLGHDDYELHGLKPHIRCREGEDAMQVALKEIEKTVRGDKFSSATYAMENRMADFQRHIRHNEEKNLSKNR